MRTRELAALAVTVGLALAGCTAGSDPGGGPGPSGGPGGPAYRLVSYDSCEQALDGLRRAALAVVTPYGLGGWGGERDMSVAVPQGRSASAEPAPAPTHSTTTVHEVGVDEPDLVKTDGRRIVAVAGGRLRVVDAATRRVTGSLDLPGLGGPGRGWYGSGGDLLLHGDRALVLLSAQPWLSERMPADAGPEPVPPVAEPIGPRLLVVDLSGPRPAVLSRITLDGEYVDARQVGGTVRVVARSGPRLRFGWPYSGRGEAAALRANRRVVRESTVDDWLPRWRVERDGRAADGRLPCERLSHPAAYSGASMITVHTVHLGAAPDEVFGAEDPVGVVGDGNTVYGTAESLYVATGMPWMAGPGRRTEVHRFDVSGTGRPRYAASGDVPGSLIGQYALSEHDGHLRVATTTVAAPRGSEAGRTESAVHVLAERAGRLVEVGRVGGLGKGEQIYAVRFLGPVGYVVTFRQLDPLYTLDLRDPTRPRVVGELKIPGYSAYLHPAGDGLLLGVGQDATGQGGRLGTQVSLFDVRDPARPVKLAGHVVRGGWSEAESDPHAFLWWPDRGLVVIPVAGPSGPGSGALALTLRGNAFAVLGTVRHPAPGWPSGAQVRRSLVVDRTLWTVSESGLKANDLDTLAEQATIPF